MKSLRTLVFATLAIVSLACTAQAAVYGQNDYLEANDGLAYIPMKPSTSGVLGDFNGSRVIGAQPETVTLSQGKSTTGYLIYNLDFDLSQDIQPGGEPTPLSSSDIDTSEPFLLTLNLYDIDFKPLTGNGRTYFETMTITFVRDLGEGFTSAEDTPEITLDDENYGEYRADGYGETNKQKVDYTIDLLDPEGMGLTNDDLDQILSDMHFTLQITLTSYLGQSAPGTFSYTKQKEYLGDYSTDNGVGGGEFATNELTLHIVPEPATMSILSVCSLVLLRRRAS